MMDSRQTVAIVVGLRWMWTAEAVSSVASSASCYDCVEDIGVAAIVEPECKLVQVQRQILLAQDGQLLVFFNR